ncbi:MAG TPA: ATP-binding protein [Symbiobacteriaceae bacterium]
MLRSIQSKLIFVYLLLILVAFQLSGLYLLKNLERAYVRQVEDDLSQRAQLLIGQLSGYSVGGKLDAQGVNQFMASWPVGNAIVLDANGTVIGATPRQQEHAALLGKKFSNDDVSPALVGAPKTTSRGEENGEPMTYLAVPLISLNRVIGVVYLKGSLKEAYDRLKNIRDMLMTAAAIALGATAMLSVMLARTITGPVREVTRKAGEMAGGNFNQTIEVRSSDEVGQLGEMFNRMTSRLKQTLEEIQGEKNKAEAILSHMADGLLAFGATGQIIIVNPAAERILGIIEADVLGQLPQHVWPEMKLDTALAKAREEGRSLTQEIHFGPQVLLAHVTPLQGERSQPAGTVVVLHDITEMEKLERMRRDFVANVSHELKTPLTTVKSYVETLLDGAAEEPEVRARFLRVVEAETDRMARLVKDLLHLSQLDQGSINWDIQPYEVPALMEECVAKLAVPAGRKNLSIRRVYAPGVSQALFDRDKLHQVILNLLANAIEFTPVKGEITVDVRNDGAMVKVTVKDSGIGIPKEDLPRIFERFYRVDKARSRMLGGTGLGLAIARQIVELLGGAISIDSELGKGTEVVFTIPAALAAESEVS